MFTPAVWARIAAGAFVLLALGVATLQTRDGEPLIAAPLVVAAAPGRGDPLAAALERCEGSGLPATDAQACEHVWADNRRRFLGLAISPAQGAAANESPARVAPARGVPR